MTSRRSGGRLAVGVDVGHHVVTEPAFVLIGPIEVDVVEVGPQFRQLGETDSRPLAIVC